MFSVSGLSCCSYVADGVLDYRRLEWKSGRRRLPYLHSPVVVIACQRPKFEQASDLLRDTSIGCHDGGQAHVGPGPLLDAADRPPLTTKMGKSTKIDENLEKHVNRTGAVKAHETVLRGRRPNS